MGILLLLAGCRNSGESCTRDCTIEVREATGRTRVLMGNIRVEVHPVKDGEVLQVVEFIRTKTLDRGIRYDQVNADGKVLSSTTKWERGKEEELAAENLVVKARGPGGSTVLDMSTDRSGRIAIELARFLEDVPSGSGLTLTLDWDYAAGGGVVLTEREVHISAAVLDRVRLAFPPHPPAAGGKPPKDLLRRVHELRNEGRLEEAEAACREYVRLAPEERMGWEILAQILSQKKKYREAAELCRRGAERVERGAENLLVSAARYYENGYDIDRAREMYNRAYEMFPDYARVSALYRFELRFAQDLTDTKWKIEAVIPSSRAPYKGILSALAARCEFEMLGRERSNQLCEILRAQLEDKRDKEDFEKDLFAMQCDLVYPVDDLMNQALRLIGAAADHKLGNGLNSIRRNLRSFPDEYQDMLAEGARKLFEGIDKAKRGGSTILDFAEILRWAGREGEAEPLLTQVAEDEKIHRYLKQRALRLLIESKAGFGEVDEARSLLDAFVATAPQDGNTLRQAGRILADTLGDPSAAVGFLKKAYETQVPAGKWYTGFDYARALRAAGKGKEALEVARKCRKAVGGAMGARYMAGFLQVEGAGPPTALDILASALSLAKDPREKVELLLLESDYLLHKKAPEVQKALEAINEAERLAAETGYTASEKERIWTRKCLLANNYLDDAAMQAKYMNMLLSLRPRHENYRLWRAIALARFGKSKEEAWRAFRKIPPRATLAYNRACFFSNVGEHEKAIDLLRQDIFSLPDASARNRQRLWAAADAEFRPLRGMPAFKELVELEKE
ncbi:MAG: tetratricopeptide repeat protein [Planctomycetota bacterium]